MLVLGWLLAGGLMAGFLYQRIAGLFDRSLQAITLPVDVAVRQIGEAAFQTLLWMTLPLLAMALLLALLIEFLQVGPVTTMKKVTPNVAQLNPAEGIKKMFSMDNLVELVKSIVKCFALLFIGYWVLRRMLPELLLLPYSEPAAIGKALWHGLFWIGVWTIFVCFFVSVLDVARMMIFESSELVFTKRSPSWM